MSHKQLILAAADYASALVRTKSLTSWGHAIYKASEIYCPEGNKFIPFMANVSKSLNERKKKYWRNVR
jgi:hypothetical protein